MSEANLSRRLWLVRHGATQWNSEQRFCGHSDIPLLPEGRRQARWLARQLRAERIAAIYSSDLLRARATAEIIAIPHAMRINVSSAWRELSFGAWEGLTYGQIVQHHERQPDFFTDPVHAAPAGGETLTDLLRRVLPAFTELAWEREGAIVLVSHGGPLRALLCSLLALPLERQWQLRLNPGSLSALDLLPPVNLGDGALPAVTLTLLNVQRPVRLKRVLAQCEATDELAADDI